MVINEETDAWTGQGTLDPVQDPWKLNIVRKTPVPTPDQIPIRIEIGVTSIVRQWDQPFRPTITYTAPYVYSSDLLNYKTLVPIIAAEVFPYVQSEVINGANVETHVAVWLDNVTHPQVSAGVVRLPKGHIDGQLTTLEFTSAQVLQDYLTGSILNLKNLAQY